MRRSIYEVQKRRTLEDPSPRNPSLYTHILLPNRLFGQQSPNIRRLSSQPAPQRLPTATTRRVHYDSFCEIFEIYMYDAL
jgi:hypothetical protein